MASGPAQAAALSAEQAKVVLAEVIQAFAAPENAVRMEEARDNACNDMGKMLQFVLPVATQIQQEVLKAYGFSCDGEGGAGWETQCGAGGGARKADLVNGARPQPLPGGGAVNPGNDPRGVARLVCSVPEVGHEIGAFGCAGLSLLRLPFVYLILLKIILNENYLKSDRYILLRLELVKRRRKTGSPEAGAPKLMVGWG
uniref:Protein C10 n=1 Tax=Sarcophilus harrisii TaxID=9305 RepID=A0A7N4PK16_SARHA